MAALEASGGVTQGRGDPVGNMAAVTPDDNTDLGFYTRAVFVGTGGNLKIITKHGQTILLKNCASGSWHPIRASRILATGTTANDIVASW